MNTDHGTGIRASCPSGARRPCSVWAGGGGRFIVTMLIMVDACIGGKWFGPVRVNRFFPH